MTRARTNADNADADILGVTASTGLTGGGTSGTVTVTNSMATAIDAKGDLVAGTGADAFSRLAVGADATVLTADSAEATGLKWATPSSPAYTYTSFTAVLKQGATTITTSLNSCSYVLIGKTVHVRIYVECSSSGSASDAIFINNLPYTVVSNSGNYEPRGTVKIRDASASNVYHGFVVCPGSTDAYFASGIAQAAGQDRWGTTGSNFAIGLDSGDQIFAFLTYETS
jgi:hypothetical protein